MISSSTGYDFGLHGGLARGKLLAEHRLLAVQAVAVLSLCLVGACGSPEAGRQPGQSGADVKNWGHPVELHAGAQPYHDTPCVTEPVECHGPRPVFGRTAPPD